MKKILLLISLLLITGLIAFFLLNKRFKIIDLSTISVSTDEQLSTGKVNIKRGFYSINRENDQELFAGNNQDETVYDGIQTALLNTDYGENDFLITYDNKYYFQFRHFIFNSTHQHRYRFFLFRQQDTIFIKADIRGRDQLQFTRPMHLISHAKLLRCNTPIDSSKVMYNMVELE